MSISKSGAAAAFIVRQIEQAAEKIECLIGIEISVQIGFLRQITDARLGGDVPGRMAEHFDMPFGRIQKTEQQLDREAYGEWQREVPEGKTSLGYAEWSSNRRLRT